MSAKVSTQGVQLAGETRDLSSQTLFLDIRIAPGPPGTFPLNYHHTASACSPPWWLHRLRPDLPASRATSKLWTRPTVPLKQTP